MKPIALNRLTAVAATCIAVSATAAGGADRPANVRSRPLQVFVLAGQSNMQGHAHVRTLDAMELNPTTAAILKEMRGADGSPRVCERVWISSLGSADEERIGKLTSGFGAEQGGPKIGPEFTFGIYMQKAIDGPILIIKTAWGGKSLHTDFRPPSAGPYRFNESQFDNMKKQGKDVEALAAERTKASGLYYRFMVEHVKRVTADIKRVYPDYDPEQGYELAGFVWLQGWNDMVASDVYPERDRPGGYDEYARLLAQFIRDVRNDLAAPKLPFVIGVMGVGGPTKHYGGDQLRYRGIHQNFRDAMAAPARLPEFQGNVAAVLTEQYWDLEATALREREKTLKPKYDAINLALKEKELTREAAEAARRKLDAENFTPHELVILRESVSNAEFHYLGSARILAQIGKGLAEAMTELGVK